VALLLHCRQAGDLEGVCPNKFKKKTNQEKLSHKDISLSTVPIAYD